MTRRRGDRRDVLARRPLRADRACSAPSSSSSSPAVAARCACARAGVGAACTQNVTDPLARAAAARPARRRRSSRAALARSVADGAAHRVPPAHRRRRAAGGRPSTPASGTLGRTPTARRAGLRRGRQPARVDATCRAAMAAAFARRPGGAPRRPAAAARCGPGSTRAARRGPCARAGWCVVDDVRVAGRRPARRLARTTRSPSSRAVGGLRAAARRLRHARARPAAAPSYGVPGDESSPHPLDPLDADEITRGRRAGAHRAGPVGARPRGRSVEPREPDKADYLAWAPAAPRPPARRSACARQRPRPRRRGGRRPRRRAAGLGDRAAEGVQPAIYGDEFFVALDVMRADPRFLEALRGAASTIRRRCTSSRGRAGRSSRAPRAWRARSRWVRRDDDGDNPYSRPLYGLVAAVDLDEMARAAVDDHAPGTPAPPARAATTATAAAGPIATTCARSRSRSPRARASRSTATTWPGSGGTCASASIPARASCCTTSATRTRASGGRSATAPRSRSSSSPTATPARPRTSRTCSTSASTASGRSPTRSTLGCDCLGEIAYLDAVNEQLGRRAAHDPKRDLHPRGGLRTCSGSTPTTTPAGSTGPARGGSVISSIVTVGNYEYGFFWYLYQDGSIEFEAKLTGHRAHRRLGLGRALAVLAAARRGRRTSHHQHFFCARLDLDIDGTANVAFESRRCCEPVGAARTRTAARSGPSGRPTSASRRRGAHISPRDGRRFRVENPARRNRIGDPVGVRAGARRERARRCSSPTRRCASARRLHRPQRLGDAVPPRRALPGRRVPEPARRAATACPRWTRGRPQPRRRGRGALVRVRRAPLPRLEDWPVMPVVRCGFQPAAGRLLRPNPALDVPPPTHCAH